MHDGFVLRMAVRLRSSRGMNWSLRSLGLVCLGVAIAHSASGQGPVNRNVPAHPRLFLNPSRAAQLRADFSRTGGDIQKRADQLVGRRPPNPSSAEEMGTGARGMGGRMAGRGRMGAGQGRMGGANEMWWQMNVGSNLPVLALAYVGTGNRAYFTSAVDWARTSCQYPHWGSGPQADNDLAAGYLLLGVATVYDWLYKDLDGGSREALRSCLADRGRRMFEKSGSSYWSSWYLQNHMWVSLAGLGAAAGALLDDPASGGEAARWMALCLDKFRHVDSLLQPDGASQEGITYWSLGMDGLLRFWALAEDLLGEKPTSPWWKNTGYYRSYLSLPRNAWTADNDVVNFADCTGTDWVGPDYILFRLAEMNRDSHIEWLAEQTKSVSHCERFGACWLDSIWRDRTLKPEPPAGLPTMRRFTDMDIVSSRSDWSGNESLVAFKSGPALGHRASGMTNSEIGGPHAHPDANHFVVFGDGEWLIRDDGYRAKQTGDHNTLLVDGRGQIGEGREWFDTEAQLRAKANPKILAATSSPAMDYMAGDAASAYPAQSGLRRFVRQLVFLKPDVLIVADDIQASSPRNLELRFHPEFAASADSTGAYISKGEKSLLRIEPFEPAGTQVSCGMLPAAPLSRPARAIGMNRRDDATEFFTIQVKNNSASWRGAVVLSWAPAGQTPVRTTVGQSASRWIFHAGDRTVALKWDGGPPEVAPR